MVVEGYYDINIDWEQILSENGSIEQVFYLKDLKQRKLFITSDIDQLTVEDAVHQILQFNREDAGIPVEERKPVLLYIVSNGGEVDAGFELIDVISSSITPVYTINLGYWYSMGLLIGIAGHKRYATKNAKFLMHDGSHFIYNSGAKAQDQMEFQKRVEERVKRYILDRSKISEKEYNKKLRVEWYMFSEEAKENGLIDCIVGEDCSIEEIV